MKATTENIDRLFSFIKEQHESNNERGEFDDEMDLKDVLDSAQEHLKEAETPIYRLLEDGIYVVGSHKVTLNERIRQDELHEYSILDRREFIDELIRWIAEAPDGRKAEMKQDLFMLEAWEDDYVLSSNSTNSYIRQGDSNFNETCEELIETNESL